MGESNLLKLNTVLLVVVIVLLFSNLFWKPQSQSNGRFQTLVSITPAALDTKTGQLCRTIGPSQKDMPLCSELK